LFDPARREAVDRDLAIGDRRRDGDGTSYGERLSQLADRYREAGPVEAQHDPGAEVATAPDQAEMVSE
jgi:hypothetical protein